MLIQTTNDFEKAVLEEFKTRVEDLGQDEPTLIRFLKAREHDVDKAENMLRECLLWRKENKIDNLLKWDPPEYLKTELPFSITGCDYVGGPVLWLPMGIWNHRPWIEQGYGEEVTRWGFYIIESGLQSIKRNRDGRYQSTVIFDLGQLTYYQASHINSLRILYKEFKTLEQNYPEVLKSLVVINAPWLFSLPYNFIKGILSPHTLSKLKVFDSNKKDWLNYLLDQIPQKSLPSQYFEDENGN